ncbi:CinA family protein [Parendozoicomonas haliclonae]|uniref:Nicotinamide-nucleotide amidohydrolase PncC n=1 Tax=Parendozoicomonas haliclonae TaxID=1960125 RepID=A0A1X7AQW3_9GAMM|nr:CinA family protein [Parendozoicomonas haliclonae]SMA50480.1 Nicotinamide-nucleotide amidohydrolase PncC [Parendozoicomonas haliclonae]
MTDAVTDRELDLLATKVGKALAAAGQMLVSAESCTGGGIMKIMTDIPGSSGWCEGGFITYTNRAKQRFLGVPEATLESCGAVSRETVEAMAQGALERSDATISVAVSGIAGPDGGSDQKPVGTVWLAWAQRGQGVRSECCLFTGDRETVRRQTINRALTEILSRYPLAEA